ncbi:MAG: hypothetical protein ACF8XB_08020 [Planctomycetota bacterium JB042]
MEILELSGERFDLALDRFAAGEAIVFAGVGFRLAPPDVLECRVESTWSPANVTRARAVRDLEAGRHVLEELRRSSRFRSLVDHRRVRTVLLSTYGMGAVELCREFEGVVEWSLDDSK